MDSDPTNHEFLEGSIALLLLWMWAQLVGLSATLSLIPATDYFLCISVFIWTNLHDWKALPQLHFERNQWIVVVITKAVAYCHQDLEATPLNFVVICGHVGVAASIVSCRNVT